MERALAQYETWDAGAILKRRREMIDWALIRWGVDPANNPIEIAPDDFEADIDSEEARPVPPALGENGIELGEADRTDDLPDVLEAL